MTDEQIEKAEKSLKWVVNQLPDNLDDSNEDKMLKCIRLFCKNGVAAIDSLKAANAEAKELCRKKIGDLKVNEWIKIMKLAGYEVNAVSQPEQIEQIRKETAKEISQSLFDMAKEQGKHPMITPVDWVKNVKNLAKHYGVEIDE